MTQPIEITEAYVKSLADPLVSHMTEPLDTMSVLAIAVRAALSEAWEMIELGEAGLRMSSEREAGGGEPCSLSFIMMQHGQVYAGRKVIRRVADALKYMDEVQFRAAEAIYGHPLQYALVGGVYVGSTQDMDDVAVRAEAGPTGAAGLTVERYNRCPTCEEWSPCDRRKADG